MPVRFRILGPVEIEVDGRTISLPRPRERCLLGVLLLEANRPLSVDRLAELLWGDDPPKRIRGAVQGHISRLRSALTTAGDADGVELLFAGDGYRLVVDPETIDVHQFRNLRDRAVEITDPEERVVQLRAALDLWRGPALTDAVGSWARERLCSGLEEQRIAAFEDMASTSLLLRREREILPELARVAGDNGGRESLVGLHMRALYQAGRRADALDVYSRARAYLADELGLDPGPALRELHQAILRGQLALPPTSRSTPQRPNLKGGSTLPLVPRQLPADVAGFTGRQAQLDQLDSLLPGQGEGTTSVVISAIGGTAGVGKTALAVHAGHRIAHRYTDGQLFVDLHGFSGGVPPVEPADALDRMLRALDVPGERIPRGLEDRAALWRSVLAGRRMLIVLDNASTEAQVAPLLPGTAGCVVLVTSRRRLAALEATQTISLDVLPPADALTLFTRIAGQDRCAGEPTELVAETVELCGRLPLAIRIAAARLRSHPTWGVAALVERLRDENQRLTELEDGTRDIAATLNLSYQWLAPEPQRMYRLLGLHPGRDVEPFAAAALAGTTLSRARRLLEHLLDVHLLHEPRQGRYVFHDLVRAHAFLTANGDEPEPRRASLSRLLDYYRRTASVAIDIVHPYERRLRPRVAPVAREIPGLSDSAQALGWLDVELPNLLAAARCAADGGWPEHTWQLSAILHRHLRVRGRYDAAETLHQQALSTARAVGDQVGEAAAHHGLGHIKLLLGRNDDALGHFLQALTGTGATGDRVGEVEALNGLGYVHLRQGRYELALDHFQRALEIAGTVGHRAGEINARRGVAYFHRQHGRYDQALGHFQRAFALARAIAHRTGEVSAQLDVGTVHRMEGRSELALDHFQQALTMARAVGHRDGELDAHLHLGRSRQMQGEYEQAANHFEHALELAEEIGSRTSQFEVLQARGRLHQATGQPAHAITDHQQALALATEVGQPDYLAHAYDGLASANRDLHQPGLARQLWQQALGILTDLGHDQASDETTSVAAIRANLAALDQANDPGCPSAES